MPEVVEKDPFNMSNDEYYNPKLTLDNTLRHNVGGGGMLQVCEGRGDFTGI